MSKIPSPAVLSRRLLTLVACALALGAWAVPRSSAADADSDHAGLSDVHVELSLAARIEGRVPIRDSARPFEAGDTVHAFTAVAGISNSFITHVWYRNDKPVARHQLKISGNHWRTWSRQRVRAGHWKVVVLGAQGQVVAETAFDVGAAGQQAALDDEGC